MYWSDPSRAARVFQSEIPRTILLASDFFDMDPMLVFASLHREEGPSVIQTVAAQLPLSLTPRSDHKYHTSISPVYNLP